MAAARGVCWQRDSPGSHRCCIRKVPLIACPSPDSDVTARWCFFLLVRSGLALTREEPVGDEVPGGAALRAGPVDGINALFSRRPAARGRKGARLIALSLKHSLLREPVMCSLTVWRSPPLGFQTREGSCHLRRREELQGLCQPAHGPGQRPSLRDPGETRQRSGRAGCGEKEMNCSPQNCQ